MNNAFSCFQNKLLIEQYPLNQKQYLLLQMRLVYTIVFKPK